jgi:hypothetical protein
MNQESEHGGLTTETRRRRGDTTYDFFEDIESYCKTHHFTIFYGTIENEGFPKAVWDRNEDPRWESFLSIARSFDIKTMYLHRSTLTYDDVFQASSQVRRTHTAKIEAFTQYIGMIAYVEVSYLFEGLVHTYVYSSEWYTDFVNAVGLAPLKRDKDLQA